MIRHFDWPSESAPARLDQVLRRMLDGVSWGKLRRLIETGKIAVNGEWTTLPGYLVKPNDRITLAPNRSSRTPDHVLGQKRVLFVDSQLVIVDKPAPMSTVAYDTNDRGTLDQELLRTLSQMLKRPVRTLHLVHRLDKETTGVLVFARTPFAQRALKQQFRVHTIERRYLALAEGCVSSTTIHSRLVVDRGDGRRGSTPNHTLGQHAVTHVRALEHFDQATLVECHLETGRTHQIRIHLAERGHPLLGEKVYRKGIPTAERVMLHAASLGFEHPTTGSHLSFEAVLPDDFSDRLDRLRAGREHF